MALETKTTDKLVMTFVTELADEYTLPVTNPDRTLTEAQLLAQAEAVLDAGVIKPDGTPLCECTGIKFVRTETSSVPMAVEDDDDEEGGNA